MKVYIITFNSDVVYSTLLYYIIRLHRSYGLVSANAAYVGGDNEIKHWEIRVKYDYYFDVWDGMLRALHIIIKDIEVKEGHEGFDAGA